MLQPWHLSTLTECIFVHSMWFKHICCLCCTWGDDAAQQEAVTALMCPHRPLGPPLCPRWQRRSQQDGRCRAWVMCLRSEVGGRRSCSETLIKPSPSSLAPRPSDPDLSAGHQEEEAERWDRSRHSHTLALWSSSAWEVIDIWGRNHISTATLDVKGVDLTLDQVTVAACVTSSSCLPPLFILEGQSRHDNFSRTTKTTKTLFPQI